MADVLPLHPAPPQAVAAGPPEKAAAPVIPPAVAAAQVAAVLGQPVVTEGHVIMDMPDRSAVHPVARKVHDAIQAIITKAARDNGKDFVQMGVDRRPKSEDHGQHFDTIMPNAKKLADAGYHYPLMEELENANCEQVINFDADKFVPSPESLTKDIQDELKANRIGSDKCTTGELRKLAESVDMTTPVLLDKTTLEKKYDDAEADIDEMMADVDEMKQDVASKERQIAQLQAEVTEKKQKICSTQADAFDAQNDLNDLRDKGKKVMGICETRLKKQLIGLNCIDPKHPAKKIMRTGYLQDMGITVHSHYAEVEFDKVLYSLVNTAKGHCMVKELVAIKQLSEYGDAMPQAKKQKLMEKLSN